MNRLSRITLALCCVAFSPAALAKLPPPSDEAKAKAAEAAAKTAWSDKTGAYQLCNAQDRVAANYRKQAKAEGKSVPAAPTTPPCTNPGPYVPMVAAAGAKPLEASGAHSPPGTAVSPPSSKATAAEIAGAKKK